MSSSLETATIYTHPIITIINDQYIQNWHNCKRNLNIFQQNIAFCLVSYDKVRLPFQSIELR